MDFMDWLQESTVGTKSTLNRLVETTLCTVYIILCLIPVEVLKHEWPTSTCFLPEPVYEQEMELLMYMRTGDSTASLQLLIKNIMKCVSHKNK